jgi:hypothetical protein
MPVAKLGAAKLADLAYDVRLVACGSLRAAFFTP